MWISKKKLHCKQELNTETVYYVGMELGEKVLNGKVRYRSVVSLTEIT